jgi:hypothetical protein
MRTGLIGLAAAGCAILGLAGCGSSGPAGGSGTPAGSTPSAASSNVTPVVTLTAEQIVSKLKAAGLPVGRVIVYTDATDPNKLLGRPGQYTSKADFSDTRHPELDPTQTCSGCVEVYPDAAGALARKAYVDRVTQGTPLLLEYTYAEGNVCLRFDHQFLPSEAAAYDQALAALEH